MSLKTTGYSGAMTSAVLAEYDQLLERRDCIWRHQAVKETSVKPLED